MFATEKKERGRKQAGNCKDWWKQVKINKAYEFQEEITHARKERLHVNKKARKQAQNF